MGISIAKPKKREGAPPRPRAQVRVSASGGRGPSHATGRKFRGAPKPVSRDMRRKKCTFGVMAVTGPELNAGG